MNCPQCGFTCRRISKTYWACPQCLIEFDEGEE